MTIAPAHVSLFLDTLEWLSGFAFLYPLAMAHVWMFGACGFYLHRERADQLGGLPRLARTPRVSVLVPCFNEQANVAQVVAALMALRYPDYEVLAINDGSVDATGALLDSLAARHDRLRVIHQRANQGKAVGLNTAALVATGEILVVIDGDALLDADALTWLVRHFVRDPAMGAVTGNPRIRTRSTLLGRLQVAEFSSMVGLIKRAQRRAFGRIFTVSGVIAAFRASAVADVGGWTVDMLTEDIDISWKLQTRGWDIEFEPGALVWILMPETLLGLWRQRLRWATGGVQVLLRFTPTMFERRSRDLWPVYLEYLTSLVWACAMFVLLALGLFTLLPGSPDPGRHLGLLPGWGGLWIATTCLAQFGLSLWFDRRYDVRLHRCLATLIWYPVVFWMIGMLTSVVAIPKALLRGRGERATWVSPDRGLRAAPPAPKG